MFKNCFPLGQTATQSQRILATLVLTMLVLGTGFIQLETAAAATRELSQSIVSAAVKESDRSDPPATNQLPVRVTNAVRQAVSRQTGLPSRKLRVTQYRRQTWQNGCLGLPKPDEFCTEALVNGWQIVVSDGSQSWVVRTNQSGSVVRLESAPNQTNNPGTLKPIPISASQLPSPLDENAVFRAITSGGIAAKTYRGD